MTQEVSNYGPPGSGKTRKMVATFVAAAHRVGVERVAYMTFTKTAAEEQRERVAKALGISGTDRQLRDKLPWIGTVHSLCFRRLGVNRDNMVNKKKLEEFCDDQGIKDSTVASDYIADEMDEPYILDPGKEEIDLMRWAVSAAAHRMISIEQALELLPVEKLLRTSPQRITRLAEKYDEWKRARHLSDFDDLLITGRNVQLPVKAMIVDEVQDNSPLLWSVVDAWAAHCSLLVTAGDPFQAIYLFNGGEPRLFLGRQGRWQTIGNSYRFNQQAADFARTILEPAYGREASDKLSEWQGIGGLPKDGTTLCLARTNRLLDYFKWEFMDEGTPFRSFRGRAPLETKAADAYRTFYRLSNNEPMPAQSVAAALKIAGYPQRTYRAMDQLNREVDAADLERVTGDQLPTTMHSLQHADYFDRVVRYHGEPGLFLTPKVVVSTIHGAKGREADHVKLLRSWGFLPGQSLYNGNYRAEACVAYVGATRHRVSLDIIDGADGIPYPFDEGAA